MEKNRTSHKNIVGFLINFTEKHLKRLHYPLTCIILSQRSFKERIVQLYRKTVCGAGILIP